MRRCCLVPRLRRAVGTAKHSGRAERSRSEAVDGELKAALARSDVMR
jgi:hypothetical protein